MDTYNKFLRSNLFLLVKELVARERWSVYLHPWMPAFSTDHLIHERMEPWHSASLWFWRESLNNITRLESRCLMHRLVHGWEKVLSMSVHRNRATDY